jgi:predicted transcriptional regulator of viral defense system
LFTSDRALIAKLSKAAKSGVITVQQAASAVKLSRRATALKLAALARRGWVVRARRGMYLVLPLEVEPGQRTVAEDPWVLAREAFSPCYIGGWSAAEHWGLTEQLFRSTLVVTASSARRRSVSLLGHDFLLFRVPPVRTLGAGITHVWRGSQRVPVSTPERTIIDCLRNPELCGGIRNLTDFMNEYAAKKDRRIDVLLAEANRVASGAAWKRLGYLAELHWKRKRPP